MARTPLAFAAGFAAARALDSAQLRFARMAGSSIAAPDAAPWITDFLNAAYYRRPGEDRDVDDLRLAFCILTTRWHRAANRRLRAHDGLAFHRAFGRHRFLDALRSPRGTLSREQLFEGAAALHGDWFAGAYADPARRGWGIAFESAGDRAGHRPEARLALARVGALTPPRPPAPGQVWHTYPPVRVPSAESVIDALSRTETWPDYATEVGRFTALRTGPLAGQTFEIEVAAGISAGAPVFVRGYVTISRLAGREDPGELRAYLDELEDGLARFGEAEPRAVPEGASPILAFDLTTHEGHFMGVGRNRLVLYEHEGATWVRAAGTWERMPWHLQAAYRVAGREAQHAFWGQGGDERRSMLHQIALAVA